MLLMGSFMCSKYHKTFYGHQESYKSFKSCQTLFAVNILLPQQMCSLEVHYVTFILTFNCSFCHYYTLKQDVYI